MGFEARRAIRSRRWTKTLLTEDELAYRAARKRADEKVAITRELFRAGLIIVVPGLILRLRPSASIGASSTSRLKLGRRAFKHRSTSRSSASASCAKRSSVAFRRASGDGAPPASKASTTAPSSSSPRRSPTRSATRSPLSRASSSRWATMPADVDQEEYARVAVAGARARRTLDLASAALRARGRDAHRRPSSMEDVLESALETFRDRAARSGDRDHASLR